ncbi:hypothetical protein K4F52_000479 [Lecanicillium sp. MT-2017a]|nr:hypothetical protein K4F52_000479 [Lecanicillium sp. MT-2017a]
MRLLLLLAAAAAQGSTARASCNTTKSTIQHWLYSSTVDATALSILSRPDIAGVQALYSWSALEPAQDAYDFSAIHADYDQVVGRLGKKLWIQLQDRTFNPRRDPVPGYMHTEAYNNGSAPTCDGETCDADFQVSGWMAQQWNPAVRTRYHALLRALAAEFDRLVTGLNLPETSIAVDEKANGYSHEGYFRGELENAGYAAAVFNESYVVQYVNFWPDGWADDNGRFTESFDYYAAHGVGVGGPDLIPGKKAQVKNSYKFIPKYCGKVPVTVIAVQEPDLEEVNPGTGRKFTKEEFVDYAVNELKVGIIFWAASTPWLQGNGTGAV